MSEILSEVESFLKRNPQVSATSFGVRATKDRHLVRQMRAGRRLWPETIARVRKFMSDFDQPAVVTCGTCDRRADQPEVDACTASNCGLRQKEAA